RSRNSKARPPPGQNQWLSWALRLGLVGLVRLPGFAIYLDAVVQEKYCGRRATIPAKAHGRTLELINGLKLSTENFLRDAEPLG
ncbi:penicillin-binding protein 1B, partial [Pseudomonas aeruginosa]